LKGVNPNFPSTPPRCLIAAALCLLLFFSVQSAPADPVTAYDPDFRLSLTEPGGSVSSIVLLPRGKFLIGGFFQCVGDIPTTNVARINRDGTVDPSFRCSASRRALSLLTDSQGRIYSAFGSFAPANLIRLFPDGTLDPSFRLDFQSLRTNYSQFSPLSVLPDNRLLVAAFKTFGNSPELLWINEDATVDSHFLFDTNSNVRNVIQQSDGKVLVLHSSNSTPSLLPVLDRLDNGTIDPSFTPLSVLNIFPLPNDEFLTFESTATNQILTWRGRHGQPLPGFIPPAIENTFQIYPVISYPDADPTVVFASDSEPFTKYFRLSRAGALNLQFTSAPLSPGNPSGTFPGSSSFSFYPDVVGLSGSRILSTVGERGDLRFIIRDSNGNILQEINPRLQWPSVPAGATPLPSGQFMVHGAFLRVNGVDLPKLARINSNGTLDTSFSSPSLTNLPALRKILPLPNGSILAIAGEYLWHVGGETDQPGSLLRLNADGTLDSNYILPPQLTDLRDILLQPDGKIIALGSFTNQTSITGILRLNEDGSIDETFDSSYINKPARSGTLQPDGKLLVCLEDSTLIRLEPNGALDSGFQFDYHLNPRKPPFCLQERILAPSSELIDITYSGSLAGYYGPSHSGLVLPYAVSSYTSSTIQLPDGRLLASGAFSSISNGFAQTFGFALLNKTNATIERIFRFPSTSSFSGFSAYPELLCAVSQDEALVTAYSDTLPETRKVRLQGAFPPKMDPLEKRWDGALQLSVSSELWSGLSIESSTNLVDWLPYHELMLSTNSSGIADSFVTNTPHRFFRAKINP
jgi:uncharacterized delta-60 repeat protein